jgi:hypothetical protein
MCEDKYLDTVKRNHIAKFVTRSSSSSIYKNLFHCHKNTPHNTLRFESKLLPSSGETTKTQLIKTITHTHTHQHNSHAINKNQYI